MNPDETRGDVGDTQFHVAAKRMAATSGTHANIAQLEERWLPKPKVTSSRLAIRSKIKLQIMLSESAVLAITFSVLLFLNMCGIALYHWECKSGQCNDYEMSKGYFYGKTAFMFICGVTYLIMDAIIRLKELGKK